MQTNEILTAYTIMGGVHFALGALFVLLNAPADFVRLPFTRFAVRLFSPEVIIVVWAENAIMSGLQELKQALRP